jgi:hypothetical protein
MLPSTKGRAPTKTLQYQTTWTTLIFIATSRRSDDKSYESHRSRRECWSAEVQMHVTRWVL